MNETDRRILAAQGYVELHLYDEARAELAPLPLEAQERSDVIEILMLCLMAERKWEAALKLTLQLCRLEPDAAGGFIHAAYCLHELRRTDEALDLLSRGPASLRCKPVYYYNLGCYHARLGDREKAIQLLRQSFEMDGTLRHEAHRDPDLHPLRAELSQI